MENENNPEVRLKTASQEMLILKILKSKKLKDAEYQGLKEVLKSKVITSYDASVFIEFVLAKLRFQRTFFNGKHRAYKQCVYCNSRDDVVRYDNLVTNERFWVCETCALNLRNKPVVPVKTSEVVKDGEVDSDFLYESSRDDKSIAEMESQDSKC